MTSDPEYTLVINFERAVEWAQISTRQLRSLMPELREHGVLRREHPLRDHTLYAVSTLRGAADDLVVCLVIG